MSVYRTIGPLVQISGERLQDHWSSGFFLHNYFISEPIFKCFVTFGLQKDDSHIFLLVFQKSEIFNF